MCDRDCLADSRSPDRAPNDRRASGWDEALEAHPRVQQEAVALASVVDLHGGIIAGRVELGTVDPAILVAGAVIDPAKPPLDAAAVETPAFQLARRQSIAAAWLESIGGTGPLRRMNLPRRDRRVLPSAT